MTDNTQPEALRLAEQYDYGDPVAHSNTWKAAVCTELRRQHARITELEAQLEAVGAGGVSGPMMGQPQAMPDISALTERGAQAWAGVDAQGLRDGVASAGSEPVYQARYRNGFWQDSSRERFEYLQSPVITSAEDWETRILYTHPSPPEGTVGGCNCEWQSIETAPKDGTPLLLRSKKGRIADGQWITATSSHGGWAWAYVNQEPVEWRPLSSSGSDENRELRSALIAMLTHMGMDEDEWNKPAFDQARRALGVAPPTSSADSRKGE